MIKSVSISLLFCILCISCYQPERDCAAYKTGSFTFDYEVNGETKSGKFTRDDTYSIEYYDNKIDSATVNWVNDCEFVLQDVKTKTSIQMKILSTTEKSYTFEYNKVGDAQKARGTAFKIE